MNKMVFISYNEAIEDEVLETLNTCVVKNYTKIPGVFGRGTTSGTHLGNDIWPGRNNLLLVVSDPQHVAQLVGSVKNLRKKLGKEGIKAFVLPVEEIT
ncbi:MAG: hypothetical protein PHT59_02030 [Candidatus Omnitrophica bacterium]|nr:hypothetical protein [Candidatus Omnitrophota bacterium]